MTSRRHYVAKHNTILHQASPAINRGDNVPDDQLTPDQLAFRRQLQGLRAQISYIDWGSQARAEEHSILCWCPACTGWE